MHSEIFRSTTNNGCIYQDNSLLIKLYYSPGHSLSKHDVDSYMAPGQSRPPLTGAGFEHDRILILDPRPHVTEHSLPVVIQALHPPSTVGKET